MTFSIFLKCNFGVPYFQRFPYIGDIWMYFGVTALLILCREILGDTQNSSEFGVFPRRSAMQKVTLEQQIEQKSHAQRTAMLEKAGKPGRYVEILQSYGHLAVLKKDHGRISKNTFRGMTHHI